MGQLRMSQDALYGEKTGLNEGIARRCALSDLQSERIECSSDW